MLLYSPEMVYRLDRAAVSEDGFSEIELMQRAGQSVWRAVQQRWPALEGITVFAGSGNNGGDAFVVALCARDSGISVQFLVQGDLSRQSETSRHFKQLWEQCGGKIEQWQGQQLSGDIVVDGLLGIGLQRGLDDKWQQLIESINRHPGPRVAIDIPSGLSGSSGNPQPVAVRAELTVTFIGAKTGQFLADGPDYCGELVFEDLGVSRAARQAVTAQLELVDSCRLPPPRKRNSHKNHYGNLLIVGGDRGMSGAVTLAARAALRSGAGLVTALVHPECRNNLAAFPEIMVHGWDALADRLEQADVVIVGPGLGNGEAANQCLQALTRVKLPMVVDASALDADFLHALNSERLVITPHPGEAAGLLQSTAAGIQADRLASSARLAEDFGATCVLKGSGTLIAQAGERTLINPHGNPGMASAGMGDVLSGMIGALLGQGMTPFAAARAGVLIHALCAERFSIDQDQSGLIAGDIVERIPLIVKQLRDAG
jgi:NAD(P)H-hydrate epimerase